MGVNSTDTIDMLVKQQRHECQQIHESSAKRTPATLIASFLVMLKIFAVDIVAPPAFSVGLFYVVTIIFTGETAGAKWVTVTHILAQGLIVAGMYFDFVTAADLGSAWIFNRTVSMFLVFIVSYRLIEKEQSKKAANGRP